MEISIGLTICIIIMVMAIWIWQTSANIRKIADDGWVFYHSPSCGHCVTQISEIGALKLMWMPMVNCEDRPGLCKEKGISAFPTWLNKKTDQIHTGAIAIDSIIGDAVLVDVLKSAPLKHNLSL
jgi:hypothetical protein